MLTTAEQNALARLEWAERFRQRTKWVLLLLALATMAAAGRVFFLSFAFLDFSSSGADPNLGTSLFWPSVGSAALFWLAGLGVIVRVVAYWRGNPRDILLIRLAREVLAQRDVPPN